MKTWYECDFCGELSSDKEKMIKHEQEHLDKLTAQLLEEQSVDTNLSLKES